MEFVKWLLIRDASERGDFPEGIIFNAPRPIMGDHFWQDDFVHGIFYTVVCGSDKYAQQMIEKNHSLDAYVIEHVTKKEAIKLARDDYIARGYEDRFVEFSSADLELMFITHFENKLCKSTIEL